MTPASPFQYKRNRPIRPNWTTTSIMPHKLPQIGPENGFFGDISSEEFFCVNFAKYCLMNFKYSVKVSKTDGFTIQITFASDPIIYIYRWFRSIYTRAVDCLSRLAKVGFRPLLVRNIFIALHEGFHLCRYILES